MQIVGLEESMKVRYPSDGKTVKISINWQSLTIPTLDDPLRRNLKGMLGEICEPVITDSVLSRYRRLEFQV